MKKLLLLMALMLAIPFTASGELDLVAFTVARHVNTPLPANTVDNALADVNDRLKYDNHNCNDDVPCSVRFFRSGAVGTFGNSTDGLDVITNNTELGNVFNVTTHRVKVVTSVDFCAGSFNTSIIGCGRCNAFGYIVEDWVGGAVYVHEFGHNVMGCGHRDDCAHNIMNTFSIGTNNSVNSAECSGFGGSAYTQLCGSLYDGAGGPLTVSGGPYWVTCNVTVPAGQTLTIQAGVEVQFHMGLKIKSLGNATADGSGNQITLYSNNATKDFPSVTIDRELVIKNGGVLYFE